MNLTLFDLQAWGFQQYLSFNQNIYSFFAYQFAFIINRQVFFAFTEKYLPLQSRKQQCSMEYILCKIAAT